MAPSGSLTRAQMVEIIRRGESVSVGGRIYTKVEQLPTAAQLAGDDLDQLQQALDANEAEAKRLSAEGADLKKRLDAAKKAAKGGQGGEQAPA